MTHKSAYIWGPVSSFSGPLIAWLLRKDWHVHLATKPAFNLFTLTPLDLPSSAYAALEKALGGHENLRMFQDRLKLVDPGEVPKGTTYDALIFCGLPPNFDEARAPRAPWAASELSSIAKSFKGVPTFIVSSLWCAIQADGVVPEEFEFERRKPASHWENICQQYESRLLKGLSSLESPWHMIRLPLISGSTTDGIGQNISGLSTLIGHLDAMSGQKDVLRLNYNPNSTLWFLPVDTAVYLFWRLLEDGNRPRICNLVSTQSMLNREWLQYLAQALGYNLAEATEADSFNLPGILRKMLKDEILVKTRNLFEVTSRYQQPPTKLDAQYFERLVNFGRSQHWGKFVPDQASPLSFSPDLAQHYFQEFMPSKLDPQQIKEFTKGGASIGLFVEGPPGLSFVLKSSNGAPVVEHLDPESDKPTVRLHFSSEALARLMQRKLSFAEALVRRQVRIEGNMLDQLRAGNILHQFLQKNPYPAT